MTFLSELWLLARGEQVAGDFSWFYEDATGPKVQRQPSFGKRRCLWKASIPGIAEMTC